MIKKQIWQYAIIPIFMVSCTGSDDVLLPEHDTNNEVIDKITISIQDYRYENETRGITYTGDSTPFAWTEKDTVGIYPDRGDQMAFSMAAGVGTNTANIDGGAWGLKSDAWYAAYSPFNRKNFFNDREHIQLDYIGQVETGIANADHLGAYDFQAANDTRRSEEGTLNFMLERLNCILILRLTVPQPGTYSEIRLTADDEVFTTQAQLALGKEYVYTPIKKQKTLSLGLKDVTTTTSNQVADFLIMMAPVDLTGKTYTVSLIGANGYVYKGTKTPTKAYEAGAATRTAITLKLDEGSNIGMGGEFTTEESEM